MSLKNKALILTVLAGSLVNQVNAAQVFARYAIGASADVVDNAGLVWTHLPCPSGTFGFTVSGMESVPIPIFGQGCYSTGDLVFNLPIRYGVYSVRLYFIEPSVSVKAGRLFNIDVNYQRVYASVDLFGRFGINTPSALGTVVVVNSRTLNVKLSTIVRNSPLVGIAIDILEPFTLNANQTEIETQ